MWGLLGGFTAVALETAYRKGFGWGNWQEALIVALPALLVTFCVYKILNSSDSFFFALVWFGLMTTVARIAVGFLYLREPASWTTLVAVAALTVASGVKLWAR